MEKAQLNNRVVKFDIARTFAILCVVLCHATEDIYSENFVLKNFELMNLFEKTFVCIIRAFGRLGVPFFLFLTGALVLKREIDNENGIFSFYKKNFKRLYITYLIWVGIYNTFFMFGFRFSFFPVCFNFRDLLMELILLKNVSSPNMWYMPMILKMYILIPIIAKMVKKIPKKYIEIIEVSVYMILFIISFVIKKNNFLSLLLYILVGKYVVKRKKLKIDDFEVSLVVLFSFIIISLIPVVGYLNIIGYANPFVFICSLGLFILFNRLDDVNYKDCTIKLTNYISKISLAIYFIHTIVIEYISRPIKKLSLTLSVKTVILYIVTLLLSILVIFILSKNKYLKKWLLYYKN